LLEDSLDNLLTLLNTSDTEHNKNMRQMFKLYEQRKDDNQPGPGEMMSEGDFLNGTELVRIAIYDSKLSVLKLQ
jgi:hypothetical protein